MDALVHRCISYTSDYVWPGLGLFGESYLLFSIGTLQPIWKILFSDCFEGSTCPPRLLQSLTYSVVVGIMTGMIVIGSLPIGRRPGSLLTASLMAFGACGMTLVTWMRHTRTMFQCFAVLLFIFGLGVGGEYPMAAASATEKASSHHEAYKAMGEAEPRGQRIQLVFSMQGAGILANAILMTVMLLLLGQNGGYEINSLLLVWRVVYAVGAVLLLFVLATRYLFLRESTAWETNQQETTTKTSISDILPNPSMSSVISNVSSLSAPSVVHADIHLAPLELDDDDSSEWVIVWHFYGSRLVASSLCWMLWDIAFYGNKLFQSTFLLALTGNNTTLVEFSGAVTLNAAVAYAGYITAAYLLDVVGRRSLQQYGLLVTGLLFVTCGFVQLPSWLLVTLYLTSSFVGQVGPNATTFCLPAEIFPTQLRTKCHGIAAASGKLGALVAALAFHFVKNDLHLFLFAGYSSLAACVLTHWYIPETNGLDLVELDEQWKYIRRGCVHDYHGAATSVQFLSHHEIRQRRRQQSACHPMEFVD